MTIALNVKLTLKQIEDAITQYVAKELPEHVIDGKLKWVITKGYSDWYESCPSVVDYIEFSVLPKK